MTTATSQAPDAEARPYLPPWRQRLQDLDFALYRRLSRPLPGQLSPAINTVTNLADHSKISMAMTGVLALTGARGRRAAVAGITSVAVTSLVANAVVKPIAHRRRPLRAPAHHAAPPGEIPVDMPTSRSFPSGHTGAASAFATAVAVQWPAAGAVAASVAALVGFSRVHSGVHYPGDVAAGAVLGITLGALAGPPAVAAVARLTSAATDPPGATAQVP